MTELSILVGLFMKPRLSVCVLVLTTLCWSPILGAQENSRVGQGAESAMAQAEVGESAAEHQDAARQAETQSTVNKLKEAFPAEKKLVDDMTKVVKKHNSTALIKNDAIIFGILMLMLGLVFWTSSSQFYLFKLFYKIIPMLLVCYFLPSLLTFFSPGRSQHFGVVFCGDPIFVARYAGFVDFEHRS